MTHLRVGDVAPDFELALDSGERFRLSAHRGEPVVLYFYPEDDTEGCTIEAKEFTAELPAFRRLDASVVGISPDPLEKHCSFRDKYALAVPLVADPDRRAIEAYGLWGEKRTFGHRHVGLFRTTFIVDREGRIARVFPVRRIKGHAREVLAAVKALVEPAA